jgi:ribose transport system permease protein
MSLRSSLSRLRYRFVPDHVLGEILSKPWIDNAIPVTILAVVLLSLGAWDPGLVSMQSLLGMTPQFAEMLLVTLGMVFVLLAGGIDLSVGSVFALSNFITLALFNMLGLPIGVAMLAAIAAGGLVGAVNGVLIGFLKLRAFLTTLVTMIITKSIVDLLLLSFAVKISTPVTQSNFWDFLSFDRVFGLPPALIFAAVCTVIGHITLTRLRLGWRILAVGGSRRSAFNSGLPVRRTVAVTYILSGMLSAAAGVLYAARLNAAGSDTGVSMEIVAVTAAVVGGNSLGGGRGSVTKGVLGTMIVLLITNSVVRLGLPAGGNSLALGAVLLMAVVIDVKWVKNRSKILSSVYVSPTWLKLPDCPPTAEDSGSPYALNDKLSDVELIGLGEIDGPEDPLLDEDGNLYAGTRHGDIIRFFAPDFTKKEVFAHIGGHPLGLTFDRKGNLLACVAGMGVYSINPDGESTRLTDQTNRSLMSVIDDSRMRLADDLDVAPDGRIFFSEATIRFDMSDWMVDALEARGNGRIICHDPSSGRTRTVISNLRFPNGICMCRDGESFLFAETWGCSIKRYWFAGAKSGQIEMVVPDLPGYPDNINRASDGGYWIALVGMRTPVFDLMLSNPGLRKRMVERVAPDAWLFPNMNYGCVIKIDETGKVTDCLWDRRGHNHPMITSMREHRGWLYLGGVSNNRIGRYRVPGADPNWTAAASYRGDAT